MPTTTSPEPEDDNAQDAATPEPASTPVAASATAPTVPLAADHAATPLPPHPGVRVEEPVAASTRSEKQRRGLKLGGIIAAGALTAGLVFGGGVALGLAIPEGHGEARAHVERGGEAGPQQGFGERGRGGHGGFGRP